jgi:hypothetical protein
LFCFVLFFGFCFRPAHPPKNNPQKTPQKKQSPLAAFQQAPAWEEFLTYEYGYGEALVSRTSFTLNTYNTAGTLLDSVTLNKPAGWKPNMAQAEALYASTASWVVPQTINLVKLTSVLSVNFVAGALTNKAWGAKYLKPDSAFWKILNGLPGKDGNDFTINQIWQLSWPIYELTNNGLFNALPKDLTNNVTYMYNLIRPGGGGRMDFSA